jgi:hypothetical protein
VKHQLYRHNGKEVVIDSEAKTVAGTVTHYNVRSVAGNIDDVTLGEPMVVSVAELQPMYRVCTEQESSR